MLKRVLGVVRVRQGASSSSERAAQARESDANGPFIGKGGSSNKKGLFSRLKSSIGLGDVNVGGGDISGIDPTVDAVRELGQMVAPVKNVFKGMSAKAIGIFKGRIKKKRGDEIFAYSYLNGHQVTQTDERQFLSHLDS